MYHIRIAKLNKYISLASKLFIYNIIVSGFRTKSPLFNSFVSPFKDGSEHSLLLPGCSSDETTSVFCVVGNRDHTLFAAITSSSIYIFLSDVSLKIGFESYLSKLILKEPISFEALTFSFCSRSYHWKLFLFFNSLL